MSEPFELVVATRRSALALAQTRAFARALEAATPGLTVRELHVVTEGDRVQDRALREVGGKGLFVKELERALLEGRADFAVHSLKDVPAELAPGLVLACVPARESAFDALVTRDGRALAALPEGARVGTSSLRRSLQLGAARPDLRFELLRGNIDTRLRRLDEGAFDAIVLAEAGLRRLGVQAPRSSLAGALVPSVGQGALALEARADDARTGAALAALEHAPTRVATRAERALLRALEADCAVPVGAYAAADEGGAALRVEGFYAAPAAGGGYELRFATRRGSAAEPEALGAALAHELSSRARAR
jgi:hydroxymethylbilane synthase